MSKDTITQWKQAKSLADAQSLIDRGVLLGWDEARSLLRMLTDEEQATFVRYTAERMGERVDDRLAFELALESVFSLLSNAQQETLIESVIDGIFAVPTWSEVIQALVEIGLSTELSDSEHDSELNSVAVVLVCELGLALQDIAASQPEVGERAHQVLTKISTHLLSVSNSSNTVVRLSLIHYFGRMQHDRSAQGAFSKIMSRFGHTALDYLFTLLFNKKTEAISLQFLLENLPYVLEGDRFCQRIFFEAARQYMLKRPDRFTLFIQALSDRLLSDVYQDLSTARVSFMQHIVLLVRTASDVNHRRLGADLLAALSKFRNQAAFADILASLTDGRVPLRDSFRDLVRAASKAMAQASSDQQQVVVLRSSKRGRRPSFQRTEPIHSISQVVELAKHQSVALAS